MVSSIPGRQAESTRKSSRASPSSMGWYSPRAIITEEEVSPGSTTLAPQSAPQKLYQPKFGVTDTRSTWRT